MNDMSHMLRAPRVIVALALLLPVAVLGACASGLDRIDRHLEALVADTTSSIGAEVTPNVRYPRDLSGLPDDAVRERPSTVNPGVDSLAFDAAGELDATSVIDRLEAYGASPDDAVTMDLFDALAYAVDHSRDFRFAEEDYVLSGLRLLIERHQWGPRFFDEVSADFDAIGDGGLYDSSLSIVNELSVTQRLPYGGTISASALARATEDLHLRVSGENVQSAEVLLRADVPLLRGAGLVARETRIQRERDLVYAARAFERFRRSFLFDVSSDFLNLIVLQRRIDNARRGVESFQRLETQQDALYRAGRSTPFDTAEAQNETLEAVDGLNNARESYRLALDRFKVSIGMPVAEELAIEPGSHALPVPRTDIEEAVYAAMQYRLDLQTRRDEVDDARRDVANARNGLLGDLNLTASVRVPTEDGKDRAGLQLDVEDSVFAAGITYGLPLDREIERAQLREAQIGLERSMRDYDRFRDDVALSVRAAVRAIDSALFSLRIQERNVEIALQREASIEADPARADIRQKTDAINQTARARNARDDAERDLEVAVLRYLLETGQLRVEPAGGIRLPAESAGEDDLDDPDDPGVDPVDGSGAEAG